MGYEVFKTTFNVTGGYGSIDQQELFSHHSRSSDMVAVYDEKGNCLFCYDDTMENSVIDAINRLCFPESENGELKQGVERLLKLPF